MSSPLVKCDRRSVKGDQDIDRPAGRTDGPVAHAYLVEVVPPADARLVVLVREYMVSQPGKRLREGVTHRLDSLTCLAAYFQCVIHAVFQNTIIEG